MGDTTPQNETALPLRRRKIRVTLNEAQAEALLAHPDDNRVDPRIRLQARGKLTSALLSDRTYTPPLLREDAVPHQGDVSERGHKALMDALRRGEIR